MATAEKQVYPHISKDAAVCSGSARVAGTRIRVLDIVEAHEDGLTADDIVKEYRTLTSAAEVYAALLYYHDHRDEVDAERREEDRLHQTQRH
jgi:uncharacterized protein (DUF433 family)